MGGTGVTGILLVNLGTPEAPTAGAIRRWLHEFLRDRRVVRLTRWLWWPILYLFVLPFRPRRLAHAYQQIWTAEGSPLLAISRRQAAGLAQALPEARVQLAMRYGKPSIADGLRVLRNAGVGRLLVLPLYPQYSATTTASVQDGIADALHRAGWNPALRIVMDYHDDRGYIAALAESVKAHWQAQGRGDKLLMSFHSIPESYARAGDPYHGRCHITARLLADTLGLKPGEWCLGFQSRIGKARWLRPYTDYLIEDQAAEGVRKLDVIAPGFSADCLETLEEIALRYAALFRARGGGELRYVPALNDRPSHLAALAGLARRHQAD